MRGWAKLPGKPIYHQPPKYHCAHTHQHNPTTGPRSHGNDTTKGAPAAAADRTQRPDGARGGKKTVQGPVKNPQPDGLSHGGGGGASSISDGLRPTVKAYIPAQAHRMRSVCLALEHQTEAAPTPRSQGLNMAYDGRMARPGVEVPG